MAAMNRYKILCWFVAFFVGSAAMSLQAQGTAFFYQGELNNGGSPASGNYDFQFSLYDAPTNGNLIAGPLTNLAVTVTSGLFTTNIDFGAVFTGTNYWLEIGVRPNGDTNAFTALEPLQPLLPVPYAIFANSASNVTGTVSAAQLSGTLSSTQLSGTYTTPINFNNPGNSFSGVFSGNGSELIGLSGTAITSGTVADARLSTNVAFLDGNQTFTGSNVFTSVNSFTNRGNTFVGSFFGNGLVGWIPVSITSTQAMPDAGYLLLSSNLTTVTLPPANALTVGDIIRISGGGPGGWQVAQNAGQSVIGSFSGYGTVSWLPSTASSLAYNSMASSSDGSIMAAVAGQSIYLSTDDGYNWLSTGPSTGTYSWNSVACSENGSLLMAGVTSSGAIFYSTNFGGSWVAGIMPTGAGYWHSIAMSANGNIAVASSYENENSSYSGIYTTANGGVTWQSQISSLPSSSGGEWSGVACSASGSNMVAVTGAGNVYISSNGGSKWTSETMGSGALNIQSVASSSDGSKLAAVVNGGRIYTSANYGATWQQQTGAPSAAWKSIASSSDGSMLVAVVDGGGIYISINYGVTWTEQSAPTSSDWSAVCTSGDGTHIAAGISTGGIYYASTTAQTSTTTGTGGYLSGSQGSAVELQYLGNGEFMPVSSAGSFRAN
jgi:photosystem II stability/assembly factor-like uncharacterized protein